MRKIEELPINVYNREDISEEKAFERHAFHVVVIYEHKFLSFLQRFNKNNNLMKAGMSHFKKHDYENQHILKYEGLNGNITIRFPYKSGKNPLINIEDKRNSKAALLVLHRILNQQGRVKWIEDLDDDLLMDNREFSKKLGTYYEKQHFEDKMREMLELEGMQTLTEAQRDQARYELGEKEFERRMREGIPIVFK